jgi:hypothetical protein
MPTTHQFVTLMTHTGHCRGIIRSLRQHERAARMARGRLQLGRIDGAYDLSPLRGGHNGNISHGFSTALTAMFAHRSASNRRNGSIETPINKRFSGLWKKCGRPWGRPADLEVKDAVAPSFIHSSSRRVCTSTTNGEAWPLEHMRWSSSLPRVKPT